MRIRLILKKATDFVLDLLFPKFCVGCSSEGKWLCEVCAKKIIQIKTPTCPTCQRVTPNGQFCQRCRSKSNLTGLIVAAYYEEGPLKEAIHTFKYDKIFDLADDLGKLLSGSLDRSLMDKWTVRRTVIISVPLHKKRLAERGFNQAELLAKHIAGNSKWLQINSKLIRHKYQKKSQAELSGSARRKNLEDCFSWTGDQDELNGKIVILIDDVYTTGSTLNECAKTLRSQANAREVWGLVLAKA
jgi:ComF family protein